MGKKLIIKGADFSANGILGNRIVTPSTYARKGAVLSSSSVVTGWDYRPFAVYLMPVTVGKQYKVKGYGNTTTMAWGLTAGHAADGITDGLTPDRNYWGFPSQTTSLQEMTIDAVYEYLAFTVKISTDVTHDDLQQYVEVIEINE